MRFLLCLVLPLVRVSRAQYGGNVDADRGSQCLDDGNRPVTSCAECLWRPDCVWCPERVYVDEPAVGCIVRGSYNCSVDVIFSRPKVERVQPVLPLSQKDRSVQLTPQRMRVEASPNTPIRLNFSVALANVPVDIYFVMDHSNSMDEHKRNLVNAAHKIAKQVTLLTRDYQLGFGSFSDKPTPPFSSELSYYERSIRAGTRTQPPPYSFRHQLRLTDDVEAFRLGVEEADLAGNIDSPESGMDALMQAITCDRVIGWRTGVRKVIIFITDQDSHFAYDGQLAGLPEPQDGQCRTTKARSFWEYEAGLKQDYPSFGQIKEKLNDKNMVVIFAVKEYMDAIYRELSKFLQGTENIGHLTQDASSLEKIIAEQYEQIKSRIVMQIDTSSPSVEVSLTSDCPRPGPNFLTCPGVVQGRVVNFTATVVLREDACSLGERERTKTVELKLSGFEDARLTAKIQCETCECGRNDPSSRSCSGVGNLVCGGCECPPSHSGRSCQCHSDAGVDLTDRCKAGDDGEVCSGRGTCICGRCDCSASPQFIGRYCECERDCPFATAGGEGGEERECSGHGKCHCQDRREGSRCTCLDGYTGEDCSCPPEHISRERCRDERTGQDCFGRGKCHCGVCKCESEYEGKFCQRKVGVDTCKMLEPCVKADQLDDVESSEDDQVVSYWAGNCPRSTKELYGIIYSACALTNDGAGVSDGEERLLYDSYYSGPEGASRKSCEELLQEFAFLSNRNENELNIQAGRIAPSTSLSASLKSSGLKMVSTKSKQQCIGEHDGCYFTYYHDNLESDTFFMETRPGSLFVVHRNVSGRFRPLSTCDPDSMMLILAGTTGTLFLVGLGLIVAAVVIVNLNDLRRWQQYQAWKAENERRLGEHSNPLYQAKGATTATFKNPAFEAK